MLAARFLQLCALYVAHVAFLGCAGFLLESLKTCVTKSEVRFLPHRLSQSRPPANPESQLISLAIRLDSSQNQEMQLGIMTLNFLSFGHQHV
jgi:hypothetical protein